MSISEQIKTIKQNVPMVHQAGYEMGYSSGYSDGEQAEYDKFWDALQKNGTQTNYKFMFAGRTWNSDIFKPKYDMKPSILVQMFSEHGTDTGKLTDIADVLEKQGVSLDTSLATNFSYFANGSNIKRFPILDTRAANSLADAFNLSAIETIDELILKNDGTQTFSKTFNHATKLKNIVISGVIGSAISFEDSELLTKESIISIVSALSTTVSGKSITFSKTAINNAFEINVDDETTYPVGSEYYTLRHSKDNWTFNYS